MKADDLLKVSQTTLEDILIAESRALQSTVPTPGSVPGPIPFNRSTSLTSEDSRHVPPPLQHSLHSPTHHPSSSFSNTLKRRSNSLSSPHQSHTPKGSSGGKAKKRRTSRSNTPAREDMGEDDEWGREEFESDGDGGDEDDDREMEREGEGISRGSSVEKCQSPKGNRPAVSLSAVGGMGGGGLSWMAAIDDAVALSNASSANGGYGIPQSASAPLLSAAVTFSTETSSSDRPYGGTGQGQGVEGSQLEYLEDSFQLIALMVRGNAARMKDDMK